MSGHEQLPEVFPTAAALKINSDVVKEQSQTVLVSDPQWGSSSPHGMDVWQKHRGRLGWVKPWMRKLLVRHQPQ